MITGKVPYPVERTLLTTGLTAAAAFGSAEMRLDTQKDFVSGLTDALKSGIGTLVDMDSLEIEVDVNENFINRVQPAQPVTVRLNAYPEAPLAGEVIAVIPTADRSKATVKVRIGLREMDARGLPEMGVRVAFLPEAPVSDDAAAPAQGVRVPAGAVQDDQVWVLRDDRVERRPVSDLEPMGGDLRVGAGLRAGETVVVDPPPGLEDGQAVQRGG